MSHRKQFNNLRVTVPEMTEVMATYGYQSTSVIFLNTRDMYALYGWLWVVENFNIERD